MTGASVLLLVLFQFVVVSSSAAAAAARVARSDASVGVLEVAIPANRFHAVAADEAVHAAAQAARGQGGGVELAGRAVLAATAARLQLGTADIAHMHVDHVHEARGAAGTIVKFGGAVAGVPVINAHVAVAFDAAGNPHVVTGHMPSLSGVPVAEVLAAFAGRSMPEGAALALSDLFGETVDAKELTPTQEGNPGGGFEHLRLHSGGLNAPVRIRRVLFPSNTDDNAVECAYQMEIDATTADGENEMFEYVISAVTGRLLKRASLVAHDAFTYRVLADAAASNYPLDGPYGNDQIPNPVDVVRPGYRPPTFAQQLVTLQNGPISTNDPWLAPGATNTSGNNVIAYADLKSPDGFNSGDESPSITSPATFDYTDVYSADPNSTVNRAAGVVNMFYLMNYLHDMFYDYGFNEAAGNAQMNNFGRGGLGGDPLLAEGQDYSGTNNANMLTPLDGKSPRMQMYLFSPFLSTIWVSYGAFGNETAGNANFPVGAISLTANVVAATSATTGTQCCEAITNSVVGGIALIDRGTCTFLLKVQNAQAAGAVGVIIVNNVDQINNMALGTDPSLVTIPVLSIRSSFGAVIRANIGLSGTMFRTFANNVDATLDNGIMAHEWGHYLHHRLVSCSNHQCGTMSEGYGDFTAMLVSIRADDASVVANGNWNGVYATGQYASQSFSMDTTYFGIRRFPYSSNFSYNPLTYIHMADSSTLPSSAPSNLAGASPINSEVHNAGEVWCNILWECYAALLRDTLGPSPRLTFAEARSRMMSYYITHFKLTPADPNFQDARNALLIAAGMKDSADGLLFCNAFAKRGMGFGAVDPTPNSATFNGIVESYSCSAAANLLMRQITAAFTDCNSNSKMDNGETGTLSISLFNLGSTAVPENSFSVSLSSSAAGLSIVSSVLVPYIGAFGAANITVPFSVVPNASGPRIGQLKATLNYTTMVSNLVAFDYTTVISSSDNFELPIKEAWTLTASPNLLWVSDIAPNDVPQAFGMDFASNQLASMSVKLNVSSATPLTITISHRYQFEYDVSNNYDGGVVYISTNTTDTNIVGYASSGTTGALSGCCSNQLSGETAFVKQSPGYPAFSNVTFSLNSSFAGNQVSLSFVLATDDAAGYPTFRGWDINYVSISGLNTMPFLAAAPGTPSNCPVSSSTSTSTSATTVVQAASPASGIFSDIVTLAL